MAAGLYDITNEILGKGHFAVVKLAKHCLTGEHVAIKIIDKAKLKKEGLEQLSCEIRLWSILSEHEHPNVVKLYQCIDTRTKLYLVMEYCGGLVCDLYDHIQKKNDGNGLDEEEAKHIFKQVCNAIHYCHSLKIVHRDLKPENILIISSKNSKNKISIFPMVKLIDFGFSNQYSDDELLRTSCGSLAYSAPEILLGNKYDGPKVDIWGLGCILYILLYGSNPFMQFNDNETLIKILDCSFTTPERPTINQASIDLIKGLLKKDPESRLTIDEIINHPWMASSDLSAASCDKREIAKMPVQEHIIEQMIDQGISLSKDTIEKILRNEHSDTGDGDNLNDHHYIKATYHLLKDKSARECKGVDRNMNSTYNRRGNIMKKPNYSKLKKLHNIQEKKVIGNTVDVDSLKSIETQELDVPQNTASLLLPLARKCSIVSEEGNSCAESNLPEQSTLDTNDVTTNSIESIQPKVNIFVTESSNDTPDTPTFDHDDDRKPNYEDNSLAKKLAASLSCKDSGGLHSVSSSPDFMNEHFSNIEEETPSLVASIDAARNANQLKNDQDRTLTTIQDEPSILNRYTNFQKNKKLPNVRVMKPVAASVEHSSLNPNGKSPSMRVIIQSKSMNNLTLDEQPPETKITNSISNVSIKARKTEKADCCVIS